MCFIGLEKAFGGVPRKVLSLSCSTEFAREGALSELLYADDFVLMSETIKGLRNEFLKWKDAFECNDLKDNLVKTKLMVCGGITKDGMSKSKVDPCGVCSL